MKFHLNDWMHILQGNQIRAWTMFGSIVVHLVVFHLSHYYWFRQIERRLGSQSAELKSILRTGKGALLVNKWFETNIFEFTIKSIYPHVGLPWKRHNVPINIRRNASAAFAIFKSIYFTIFYGLERWSTVNTMSELTNTFIYVFNPGQSLSNIACEPICEGK